LLLALVLPTTIVGVVLVVVDETVAPGYTFSVLPGAAVNDPLLPDAASVAPG
jgi:hypothetical protein